MRRALYDPERGYYARRITGVGRRGDFTTAPMLSKAPARAIAAWAVRALRETGCRDLIEIGPGEGALAAAVRAQLPWRVRWSTRLHLVETSAPLREIQKQSLGRRAVWHASPAEALDACNGRAVIFSNELVDAFPVRRFRKTGGKWREIAVTINNEGGVESLIPEAELPQSSAFAEIHPESQCVEVHDSYRRWMADWLPHWKAGRMLTIDYGSGADTLYERRPHGTMRGYLLQQRIEGPEIYQNVGRMDLTADVNFADLANWAEPWASEQRVRTLAEFLAGHCGAEDAALADPAGAGGAFLVLDQKRREE